MPVPQAVILSSGGLRSLVAAALTLQPGERLRPVFVFARDGRDNADTRLDYVRLQAKALGVSRVHVLDLTHLHPPASQSAHAPGSLAGPQLLLAALGYALQHHADRVVWPVSYNADPRRMAVATEQVLICGHLADLDDARGLGVPGARPTASTSAAPAADAAAPRNGHGNHADAVWDAPALTTGPWVQTPLLEFTDAQVVQLGVQLGVSFKLAWSCTRRSGPCGGCPGCRRRAAAFDAAGLVDPGLPVAAHPRG
jgi:7-cyano-7-deazaguanine synthase in queuosine biosynthesis